MLCSGGVLGADAVRISTLLPSPYILKVCTPHVMETASTRDPVHPVQGILRFQNPCIAMT
jgi:hypothetical protein